MVLCGLASSGIQRSPPFPLLCPGAEDFLNAQPQRMSLQELKRMRQDARGAGRGSSAGRSLAVAVEKV